MAKPKLLFGPDVTQTGFSAASIAFSNDLNPARIIREILQNSMDAAVEANESPARVRFRVTNIGGPGEVPDIEGYTKAFRKAVRFAKKARGELSSPDQRVVEGIDNALSKLPNGNCYLLSIMDNGVGLDSGRMTAMLGDGATTKSGDATGSYGVGHFTAVPVSDLRYLLYGGVQSNGDRVASGCAFLASQRGQPLKSAKGLLVRRFRPQQRDGRVYDFIDPTDIPQLLADDLHKIRSEWGHGTVIHIPAFNYFGHEEEWRLSEIVAPVAAYNFGAAICRGALVVEVDETAVDEKVEVVTLDRTSIGELLEEHADQTRGVRADANSPLAGLRPAGQVAYAIYQVLQDQPHEVTTSFGNAIVHFLSPSPTVNTRVDLFRRGMWITDKVRYLGSSDFADHQPFHAVLMPEPGSELHRLIRKAEGPMHNALSFKLLDDKHEKDNLQDALRMIADWIGGHVPRIGTEEYTPDDFLVVDTGGEADGKGTRHFSMYGTPVVVQKANVSERLLLPDGEPTNHQRDGKGRKGNRNTPPRTSHEGPSRPLPFQSTVVPAGTGKHIVSLKCIEATEEVSLSLRLHENVDATCDRIWPDQIVYIQKFAFQGKGRVPQALRGPDRKEIRVHGLVAGETYQIEIEHDGMVGPGGSAALRVVLQQPPTSEGG